MYIRKSLNNMLSFISRIQPPGLPAMLLFMHCTVLIITVLIILIPTIIYVIPMMITVLILMLFISLLVVLAA